MSPTDPTHPQPLDVVRVRDTYDPTHYRAPVQNNGRVGIVTDRSDSQSCYVLFPETRERWLVMDDCLEVPS